MLIKHFPIVLKSQLLAGVNAFFLHQCIKGDSQHLPAQTFLTLHLLYFGITDMVLLLVAEKTLLS